MSYEDIREAVLTLDPGDQKRFITEVVPTIWPVACNDDSCATRIKDFVDHDVERPYVEMHMWGI